MHYRKLSNKDWKAIEDRIEKKTKWMERKTLIHRGQLVLINSVLCSLPMFMLSFLKVPRGIHTKMNTIGQESSCRMMDTKRNIGWSNGI